MIFIGDCHLKNECRNYDKRCLQCFDENQFKPYKKKTGLSSTPSKKKKGMGFEEEVRKKYNKTMAKRMPQSGGLDFLEGDISFEELLLECKKRNQVDSSGRKTISIKKEWLDKIEVEAAKNDKLPALVFSYKNEDDIYYAMKYEILLDLLLKIDSLKKALKNQL